jgi:hypothetical protein
VHPKLLVTEMIEYNDWSFYWSLIIATALI